MGVPRQPGRRQSRAWAVFGFFVALPSIALALAGLRAISADDIQRAEALRRRVQLVASNADAALQAALSNARVVDPSGLGPPGLTVFHRDADGALSFPQHRVFIADFGVVPASVAPATDGRDSPGGIPAAIVTASAARSSAIHRDVLEKLRTGTWWLHVDQRRAYDNDLVRRLIEAGATDVERNDSRLERLAQAQAILQAAPPWGTPGRAIEVQTPAGTAVVVWSHHEPGEGSSKGVVIAPAETTALIDNALRDDMSRKEWAVEIRDGRGAEVWRLNDRRPPEEAVSRALTAVGGWRLRISPVEPSPSGRSWWVYGLVVLPIALLAFGLVMTSRVVRREVALARRQAEFTAAVTHEFKSPITSLRLLMERIVSGRVTDDRALAEYHDAITRETNRLDGLVNRLLDAQQIQAGRRRHAPTLTPIAPLIAESVDRFRSQAAAKLIDLRMSVASGPMAVRLDRHTVSDAIDNLIDNAIKYSPPGTAVTVTAEAANGELALAVTDQGAGIHRDDLAHVFEPYYRGRLGDRENVRGTGLGLALVQAAATAHGGRVDVTSVPGKGSTFTLRLPLGDAS